MARDMVQVKRPETNRFAQEPQAKIGRSQFNRSHGLKTTFSASYLYPIMVDEVLPGDTFTCRLNGFARIFSPLDAPLMDNIALETFFFFVPTRLLWEHWEQFQGAHDQAGPQDVSYTIPVMASGLVVDHAARTYTVHGLAAHMGLPHGLTSSSTSINALPFRAYTQIWNEWFRDQNVDGELTETLGDTADPVANYDVRKSAKKHDYFTSCLPYLQKGTASGILGTLTTLDVETLAVTGNEVTVVSGSGQADLDSDGARVDVSATNSGSPLFVDVSALSVDVNTLRESVAIQRLLERDARGGTRYVENIKAHFGVTSPDYRLQRPEYLGGGKSMINVSPVANATSINAATSASGAAINQGELRGVGTGVIGGHGWAKSFTEHGYVIGLVRGRGDVTYFQGLDRFWSRQTRYDFYIPALAHLGEQSVLNKEIFTQNGGTDENVFGYQERWAEYRYMPSKVVGLLSPDVANNIGFWHLAEDFGTVPSLNAAFIYDSTPMTRVTTTDAADDFLLDLWFDYKCARPIPVHSIPSLMGGRF